MMLKLNLFENGVDSMKHGMEHFVKSDYKYAILHIFHGIELLLKESLRIIHPVLIYRDIDSLVKENSYTVGFSDLIIRLENFHLINRSQTAPLQILRDNRNRIAHKNINLNKESAENILGESLKFIEEFSIKKLNINFKDNVGEDNWNKIEEIIYSYNERLEKALGQVDEHLPIGKEAAISGEEALYCPHCGNETVVFIDEKEDFECLFCHEPVFVSTCDKCGTQTALVEENEDPLCEACWENISSK